MPSIFARASGSRKEKRALKNGTSAGAGAGAGAGAHSPPLTRTISTANGSITPRPDSGNFRKINGYRQEIGEFGNRASSSQCTPTKQTKLPLTPPDSPTQGGTPTIPLKFTFLPTRVQSDTNSSNSIDSFAYSAEDVTGLRPYGILGGVGSKVTLGLEDVGKVVKDVGAELDSRGLTTPMLFSSQALELNQTRVKKLIGNYIESIGPRTMNRSVHKSSLDRRETFAQDLKFAKEHELAWLLRWALSRVTRVKEGTREVTHGMLEWEAYEEWRGRERAANYPLDALPYLSALVPSDLYHQVLLPLFQLLSRFAAHSHLSGLTPHALSSLFAPLLFDIPTSLPAMAAHAVFVRAASATEHLLLAYTRQSSSKSDVGLLDLPTRLREWVIGYPSMLATDADLARGVPRRGARVVRCERASRTVRAYTHDLVVGAELWAADLQSGQTWEAWDRVIWKQRRADVSRARFSPVYRRRMAVKDTLPLPASAADQTGLGRHTSYGKAQAPGGKREDRRERERKKSDDEDGRYGSLAGKEWSMFEEGGFDAPNEFGQTEMKSRLQFDLTESAKTNISARRQTMNWTDFAADGGGFSRTDPHLAVSLTFAEPLSNSIASWPSERDALQRKLHKSQKEAIPFHHDISIRLGMDVDSDQGETRDEKGRVWVEEAFVDCWADLMMGAGWVERDELTFKESNWAIIEYRAKPSRPDSQQQQDPLADPRTSDVCILFEERVPLEYQMAIANPQEKKTFAGLFSSRNRRRGHAQDSPLPASLTRKMGEHHDFDRMLMQRATTKRVTLGTSKESNSIWHREPPVSPVKQPSSSQTTITQAEQTRKRTKSTIANGKHQQQQNGGVSEDPKVVDGKASFFSKNRVARRVKTNEDNRGRARKEREQEVEFEIHSASGVSSGGNSPNDRDGTGLRGGQGDKEDEKWMDILISNGARRMDRQDAIMAPKLLSPTSAVSPPARTSSRQPSPGHTPVSASASADVEPPHPHPKPATQYTPELTRDRSADDEAQSIEPATPRASGFSDPDPSHSHSYSSEAPELDPYAHGAVHRHHNPNTTYTYSSDDDHAPTATADMRSSDEFTTRSSAEMTNERISFSNDRDRDRQRQRQPMPPPPQQSHSQPQTAHSPPRESTRRHDPVLVPPPVPEREYREVPLVAPIPVRDTIHGIVSHYGRDLRDSMVSYDSEYDDQRSLQSQQSQQSHATVNQSPSSTHPVRRSQDEDCEREREQETDGMEELHSPSPVVPPVPLFDLTPGREPSPMRYRHGEPLQFVREAEEDSNY